MSFCHKCMKPLCIALLFAFSYLAGGLTASRFPWEASAFGSAGGFPLAWPAAENWGLSFREEGKPPVANATFDELRKYDAFYADDTSEKILYLTFDCGYENGNTESILDTLQKHKAPATFFVVGSFLSANPGLARRMQEDGHAVGNHTYHHPDMSQISTKTAFEKELKDVEALYKDITGEEMAKYYRPPQGKYSKDNLQMAKEMGYHTFFWSLAYVDWRQDNQPSHKEAFGKLLGRVHPGAIVLLHSTSRTNAEILDELLGKWEKMGYTFHPLEELTEKHRNADGKSVGTLTGKAQQR